MDCEQKYKHNEGGDGRWIDRFLVCVLFIYAFVSLFFFLSFIAFFDRVPVMYAFYFPFYSLSRNLNQADVLDQTPSTFVLLEFF